MNRFRNFIKFITDNLWSIPEGNISRFNRIVLGQVRVISLAIKGAAEDKITQKASALTYYTLWALIPVLAMFFGLAKGFGFQDLIDEYLMKQLQTQPEVANQILELVNKYLETIKGGFLVGIGVILLLWSVINVLGQIEKVFNDIWQNQKSRSFLRKFTDYFGFLILIPVVIIIASSVNIYILSHINDVIEAVGMEMVITPVATFVAKTIPYILYIISFTLIYLVIPNTHVRFLSALIPGILTGLLFQILQMLYLNSHIWFGRIHTVYSGLVALPLFLMFAQLAWILILIGAEISFAHQNIKNFMYNDQIANISNSYQRKLTLFLVYVVAKRFKEGQAPIDSEAIADQYNIPIRLVKRMLYQLCECGILSEVNKDDKKNAAYQPGIDINLLNINFVNQRLDALGTHDFVPIKTNEFQHLSTIIDDHVTKFETDKTNVLLVEL